MNDLEQLRPSDSQRRRLGLAEDRVQVILDGARADEEASGDLRVGEAVAGESRDLGLLGGEVFPVSTTRLRTRPLVACSSRSARRANAAATQPFDCLAVQMLGGFASAEQRAAACLYPQRPIGIAGPRGLRQALERVSRGRLLAASDRGLDQLSEPPVAEHELPTAFAGNSRRRKRLVIAAQSV